MSEIQVIVLGRGKEAKEITRKIKKLVQKENQEKGLRPVCDLIKNEPDPEKRWNIICDKGPHWAMQRLVHYAAGLPGGIRRPTYKNFVASGC